MLANSSRKPLTFLLVVIICKPVALVMVVSLIENDLCCECAFAGENNSCSHEAHIRRVPIFQTLSAKQIEQVSQLIVQKEFADRDIVFHEGDKIDYLILMRRGKMKLVRYGSSGEEILLDLLSPGDLYGGKSLFVDTAAKETAISSGNCGVCYLRTAELSQLILNNPEIGLKMVSYYSETADQYRMLHEIMSIKSSSLRVAMFLLEQSRRLGTDVLEISQEDIANSINLTTETVNRKISEFKKRGYIQMLGHKKIFLADKNALRFTE